CVAGSTVSASMPQAVSAEADAQSAAQAATFPRPELLKPNVEFWTQVFSQYSEYQSVIHYQDQPYKVYTVLDFRDDVVRLGPAGARRLQSKTEKAVKRELD